MIKGILPNFGPSRFWGKEGVIRLTLCVTMQHRPIARGSERSDDPPRRYKVTFRRLFER